MKKEEFAETHCFNINNSDDISVIDELPLWSAPFGLKLLSHIALKKNQVGLDIG